MAERYAALVLAGQRAGQVNPLAAAAGVSHKCLIPVGGVPLIAHVVGRLAGMAEIAPILVSVEPDAVPAVAAAIARHVPGADVAFRPAADNLAASVLDALAGHDGPAIITTADHVLLSAEAVRAVEAALDAGADAVAALARREAVLAQHPEAQRRFYELRDGGWSNCNLYALSGARALKAVEIFREGGQFAKNPGRLVTAFGLLNILLARYGLLTMDGLMARVSRRFGLRFRAVEIDDGRQAIDVDNERTYAIVEQLYARPKQ